MPRRLVALLALVALAVLPSWAAADPPPSAPVVTTSGGSASFVEGAGAVAVDSGVTVTDTDSPTLSFATVQISGNFHSGEDTLGFINTNSTLFGNVTASYNAATGVMTLASAGATATVAQWQSALRAVAYSNGSTAPSTSTRTIGFTASDGIMMSGTATRSVTVTAANNVPVLTVSSGSAGFTEGGAPVAVDPGITASDADDATLASGSVAITGAFQAGQDVLAFTNDGSTMGNVVGTYNAVTGVLAMTSAGGTATTAQWQAALRAVTYANTSVAPVTAARTVTFQVTDPQGGASVPVSRGLGITAVNDLPVITTTPGTAAVPFQAAVVIDPGVTVTDTDIIGITDGEVALSAGFVAGQDVLAVTIDPSTMGDVTGTFDATSGVLTLASASGTATDLQWQAALRAVTYRNVSAAPSAGPRTVTMRVRDGASNPWSTALRGLQVEAAPAPAVAPAQSDPASAADRPSMGASAPTAAAVPTQRQIVLAAIAQAHVRLRRALVACTRRPLATQAPCRVSARRTFAATVARLTGRRVLLPVTG